MHNSGKNLEEYVKTIIGGLLPPEYKISSRVKSYNEDGISIGEYDIIVQGKFLTFDLKWLIECRNRPSQGSAPISWIRELITTRDIENFTQVTAVSTTGFSPGATALANKKNIGIDHVKTLEPDVLLDWFKSKEIQFIRLKFSLRHASIFVVPDGHDLKIVSNFLEGIKIDTQILFNESLTDKVSLKNVFDSNINKSSDLLKLIDENNKTTKLIFDVNYPDTESRYKLIFADNDIEVYKIIFIGDYTIEKTLVPIHDIKQYVSSDNKYTIAESVQFKLDIGDKEIDLTFHKIEDKDQVKIFATQKFIER